MLHSLVSGRRLDGANDAYISGTATQIAYERLSYFLLARMGGSLQQRKGRHQHTGSAKAALDRIMVHERLLEAAQSLPIRQPLDRAHLPAVDFDSEHHARVHGLAIHQDGARPALPCLTAVLGSSLIICSNFILDRTVRHSRDPLTVTAIV
jgi:hypothetical protein